MLHTDYIQNNLENEQRKINLFNMMVVDVTALGEFASIKCIILTSNRVENLEFVKNLPYLQELYAASNNIKDIRQILYLQQSWRLFNVSFHSNPCSLSKNYRQYIIKALPQIVVLDGQNISTQDRAKSLKLQYDQRFDFFEEPTDLKQILKEHSLLKNTVSSIYKEEQNSTQMHKNTQQNDYKRERIRA